jgi:hypothetical protein
MFTHPTRTTSPSAQAGFSEGVSKALHGLHVRIRFKTAPALVLKVKGFTP